MRHGALGAAVLLLVVGCARSPRAASTSSGGSVGVASARDVHDATVASLRSDDFVVRTRAARTLVAAGEAALPALGRAGAASVTTQGGVAVSSTRSVIDAILEDADDGVLEGALKAQWSVVRRGAAQALGRRERWDAIPLLIERLNDSDPVVRAASGSALRRLTNNFFGYRAQARLGQRRRAVTRWRDWWSREGLAEAQDRAARRSGAGELAAR